MLVTSDAFQDKLNSKHRKIKTDIKLYDTWFAYPSNGITFRLYEWVGPSTTVPDWSGKSNITQILPGDVTEYGVIPNLMSYWGTNPPYFTNIDSGRYAIEYSGYFDVDSSLGTYLTFRLAGKGINAEMVFNGSTIISSTDVDTSQNKDYIHSTGVTTSGLGKEYFTLRIYGNVGVTDGGVALLYEYEDTHTDSYANDAWYEKEGLKVVDASVVNDSSTSLSSVSVVGHSDISGKRTLNEPTTYSFKIPFGDNAYVLNRATNSYEWSDNSDISLREGKLLEIYAGYDVDNPDVEQTIGELRIQKGDPLTNKIDPTTWVVGTTGSQEGFTCNGDPSENAIVEGVNPFSRTSPLWECIPDSAYDGDGGWRTDSFSIDHTKTYKFSVWIKRTGTQEGAYYLGCYGSDSTLLNLDGTANTNPYFSYGDFPENGKWYYVEGYIHPSTYSSTTSYGGIYDALTGEKVGNATDFKFDPTATVQYHRVYHFYDTDTSNRQYMWNPRVEEVDSVGLDAAEVIPRATVFITGFKADPAGHTITVEGRDAFSLAESALCINIPNPVSYWSAGYVNNVSKLLPETNRLPVAYDNWHVTKAIKDLLMQAGMPAGLFYGSEYRKDRATGNLVETTNLVLPTTHKLAATKDYGTDTEKEFLYGFDVGTKIYEALMKIVNTYGYEIAIREDGFLRLAYANNATNKIDCSDYTGHSGTPSKTISYKALTGKYYTISDANEYIEYEISGNGVQIVFKRDASSGAPDNDNYYWQGSGSTKVEIFDSSSTSVYTETYNLYYDTDRYYKDGFDYSLGHNPCLVNIKTDLEYDTYTVRITNLDGSYAVSIDEVWEYNYNYTNPAKTLGTYRIDGNIATLKKLNYSRGLKDYRNDVLVVGRRKGVWVATGEASESEPDTANPTYRNTHSRSIDVEAIYNKSAINYSGRHVTTYVQEHSIDTTDRARWLSYGILNTYRNISNDPSFSVIGDPEIEVSDCVSVHDKADEDGNSRYWITSLKEDINKKSWIVTGDVNITIPNPSYEENTDIDISNFDNNYAINIEVTDSNGNSRGSGADSQLDEASGVIANSSLTSLTINSGDESGFVIPGSIVIYDDIDDTPHYFIFRIDSNASNVFTGEVVYATSNTYTFKDNCKVLQAYNPYEQSDADSFMKVKFDCLVKGRIKVGIYKENITKCISGLSDGGGFDGSQPKWQDVWPGDSLEFLWGGVDNTADSASYDQNEDSKVTYVNYMVENGNYYYQIEYESYDNNDTIFYNTGYPKYTDKDGTSASPLTFLSSKSGKDSIYMEVTNVGNGRDMTKQYTFDDGGLSKPSSDGIHQNYILVTSDNDFDIGLKGSILPSRKYFVKAKTVLYRIKSGRFFVSSTKTKAYHLDLKLKNTKDWFDVYDNAITIKNDSFRTITVIPESPDWGGYSVDTDYNIQREKMVESVNSTVHYFYLVYLDINDMSGHRVKLSNAAGSVDYSNINFTNNNYSMNVYAANWGYGSNPSGKAAKDYFATGVVEFMCIPITIEQDSANYVWLENLLDYNITDYIRWERVGYQEQDTYTSLFLDLP